MGQQRWSPIRQKPGSVSSTASRREGKYEHLKELSGFFVFFFRLFSAQETREEGGVSLSGSGVQRAKSSQLLQPAFTLRMNRSLGSSRHTGTAR